MKWGRKTSVMREEEKVKKKIEAKREMKGKKRRET